MKLWFKAKDYGWGWYPVTWQGWAVTLGFVVLILVPQQILWFIGPENVDGGLFAALYLPYTVLLVVALLWICFKTGEKPEWRWGRKK